MKIKVDRKSEREQAKKRIADALTIENIFSTILIIGFLDTVWTTINLISMTQSEYSVYVSSTNIFIRLKFCFLLLIGAIGLLFSQPMRRRWHWIKERNWLKNKNWNLNYLPAKIFIIFTIVFASIILIFDFILYFGG